MGAHGGLRSVGLLVLVFASFGGVSTSGDAPAARPASEDVPASKEEGVSAVAISVSATLLGCITFMMSLFYCTNYPDPDMRKYTYCVISDTISIFCSVLWFQMCDDFMDRFVLHGLAPEEKVAVNMVHMLVWLILLQLALGYFSGATTSHEEEPSEDTKEKVELNLKFYSILLAHTSGFASINAWGTLQQLPYLHQDYRMPFIVVILGAIGQFSIARIFDQLRFYIAAGDGEIDEYEKMWNEAVTDAEIDVMSLGISFNVAQAVRFSVSSVFPDNEGKEPWHLLCSHSDMEVTELLLIGCCSLVLLVIANEIRGKEEKKRKKSIEVDEEFEESFSMTFLNVVITSCSMISAWCCFYGAQWFLARPFRSTHEEILLAVVLTIVISSTSFLLIRILDWLVDQTWTGDHTDEAVRRIIQSFSVLVGFAWEQCFDRAVDSLAKGSDQRLPGHGLDLIVKVLLTVFVVLLVAPAWKQFILPMVEREGYECGFVIDHTTIDSLLDHKKFKEKLAPKLTQEHLDYMHYKRSNLQCDIEPWPSMAHVKAKGRSSVDYVRYGMIDHGPNGNGYEPPVIPQSEKAIPQSGLSPLSQENIHLKESIRKLQQDLQAREKNDRERQAGYNAFNARMGDMLNQMATMEAKMRDVSPGAHRTPRSVSFHDQCKLQPQFQTLQPQPQSQWPRLSLPGSHGIAASELTPPPELQKFFSQTSSLSAAQSESPSRSIPSVQLSPGAPDQQNQRAFEWSNASLGQLLLERHDRTPPAGRFGEDLRTLFSPPVGSFGSNKVMPALSTHPQQSSSPWAVDPVRPEVPTFAMTPPPITSRSYGGVSSAPYSTGLNFPLQQQFPPGLSQDLAPQLPSSWQPPVPYSPSAPMG